MSGPGFEQVNISAGPSPALLVEQGGGAMLLFNSSDTATVWFGDDPFNTVPEDTTSTAPFPPLSFIVFDGQKSVYGAVASGDSAIVSRMPGGLNFFQVAELIVKTLLISASAGNGIFVYSGTPGLGDLVASIVASGGVDPFGNPVGTGLNIGDQSGGAHFGVALNGNVFISDSTGANLIQIRPSLAAMLFYPAAAAPGNLNVAIASKSGTDPQGNPFAQGVNILNGGQLAIGDTSGPQITGAVSAGVAEFAFPTNRPAEAAAGFLEANVNNSGAVNEFLTVILAGPEIAAHTTRVFMDLNSAAKDGTFDSGGVLSYQEAGGGTVHEYAVWGSGGLSILAGEITAVDPATGTVGTPAAPEVTHFVGGSHALGTTFGAAWGNAGGTAAALAFWITAENELALEGVIATTGTSPNNNIFTLPAAYRPASDRRIGVNTAAAPSTAANLQIAAATGIVQISNAVGGVATTIGISVRFRLSL